MILPGAEQQVKNKFESEATRLEGLFAISLVDVKLEFEASPRHLGAANPYSGVVYISSNYLNTPKNVQVILDETILHELCHIIATRKFKSGGHDRAWRYVYHLAGGNGQRLCSSKKLDIQDNARKSTRILGHCSCGARFDVSLAKLTRMRNRTTENRICNRCKKDLGYTFVVDKKIERLV